MTPSQWAQWVLWVPCGIAFLVALSVGLKNFRRLARPMGLPKWDFNQSWASNITIVSGAVSFGILTTLLTGPEMCLLEKRTYTYLVLFFPALVTLAPVIFNFTREVKVTNANPTEVKIQGRALPSSSRRRLRCGARPARWKFRQAWSCHCCSRTKSTLSQ